MDLVADISAGMRIVICRQHIPENKVYLPECCNYIRKLWHALYSSFIYHIAFIFLMQGQREENRTRSCISCQCGAATILHRQKFTQLCRNVSLL